MGSSIKRHRRKQWEEFALLLKNKTRIETFNKAFNMVSAMSGLYEIEAKPIWDFLQKINPVSIVEIGRCMGGSLWMFGCACANLKKVLSIDIESYELSDPLLEEWFKYYKVDCDIKVEDSTQYQTNQMWDFVFIDGGHTGSIVKSDIKIWKDHCKYIGFHDFADKGSKNKHIRVYTDVVEEIQKAQKENNWKQIGQRGRSEIIFKT